MANQIRISPSEMRSRASSYRAEGENLEAIISKMDTLLQTLQGEWEGAASQSYAERYEALKPGFVKARELVEEIAVALETVASTMEQTDADIASAFRYN